MIGKGAPASARARLRHLAVNRQVRFRQSVHASGSIVSAVAAELVDVRKTFGPTVALDRVSLRAYEGEVHAIIGELAAEGIGIMLISSELPEVLALSDRVLVMREGRQMAILDRDEADQETVMTAAMGQKSPPQPSGAAA